MRRTREIRQSRRFSGLALSQPGACPPCPQTCGSFSRLSIPSCVSLRQYPIVSITTTPQGFLVSSRGRPLVLQDTLNFLFLILLDVFVTWKNKNNLCFPWRSQRQFGRERTGRRVRHGSITHTQRNARSSLTAGFRRHSCPPHRAGGLRWTRVTRGPRADRDSEVRGAE